MFEKQTFEKQTFWHSIKYFVQQIASIKSSAPMISHSVELRLFNFCLVDPIIGKPRPNDNPPPECPLIFGCTANDASTHHLSMRLPFALRTSGRSFVPLMYRIKCENLDQLSTSGSRTRVVRNAIDVHVSGLARLVTYSVFATMDVRYIVLLSLQRCC